MWPLDLYTITEFPGEDLGGILGFFELYSSLGVATQAAVAFGVTLVLGSVLLGIMPGYGTNSLGTSRRSPIISFCVGVPTALVLVLFLSTGLLIANTSIGVFFAVPLLIVALSLLPAWTVLGFVTIGATIVSRVGVDRLWVHVVAGALVGALAIVSVPVGLVLVVLAAVIGSGAGARALFGAGRINERDERVVPPANKV